MNDPVIILLDIFEIAVKVIFGLGLVYGLWMNRQKKGE